MQPARPARYETVGKISTIQLMYVPMAVIQPATISNTLVLLLL